MFAFGSFCGVYNCRLAFLIMFDKIATTVIEVPHLNPIKYGMQYNLSSVTKASSIIILGVYAY